MSQNETEKHQKCFLQFGGSIGLQSFYGVGIHPLMMPWDFSENPH